VEESVQETQYYVLQAQTKQTFGPLKEEQVREWIRQMRIGKLDSITKVGEQNWTPLSLSEFQSDVTNQIALQQIAASTCPHCNAEMAVLVGSDKTAVWLIIIGVVLTSVCIGLPLWIWGMIRLHGSKGKTYYQCPRCKYTTR
jgi:hypothetical protein